MDTKELKALVQHLNDAQGDAFKRRAAWKELAPAIKKTLTDLVEQLNEPKARAKLSVYDFEPWKGLPAFEVTFGAGPIGLSVEDHGATELVIERGASIQFTPNTAGNIAVRVFPSVLEMPGNPKVSSSSTQLKVIAPEDLKKPEAIRQCVYEFLQSVVAHHWSAPAQKPLVPDLSGITFGMSDRV